MTGAQVKLTKPELVFVQRMLPHFLAGKTVADCASAVLDDDARLFSAFALQSTHCAHSTKIEPRNEGIRSALASEVYAALDKAVSR